MTSAPPTSEELLLDSHEVATRPWQRFAGTTGLDDRILWRDPTGRSSAGLLHLDPGTGLLPHIHNHAAHHLWVVSGDCVISGRSLDSGSYVFVPAGVEHSIGRAGRAGCLLFYLYLVEPQT